MERRSFLASVFQSDKLNSQKANLYASGLEKFNGNWAEKQAAHLLRRTVFGARYKDISDFTNKGLDAAVDAILDIKPLDSNDLPLNYDFENDPDVPIGSTWVDKPHNVVNNSNNYRLRSMFAWNMSRLLSGEISIREKMTLFWHNHYVVADVNEARYYYNYIKLFRQDPLGSFKTLTEKITIDPAMLRYLNGNQNTKNAPNENYARELLELFTIGKGPIAGPGDYTFYTEDDVIAIAKILTGWTDVGYRNPNVAIVTSNFRTAQHDTSNKTLSKRFNNAVVNNSGREEYLALINIIFQQNETAKFISRKLYRWFVNDFIDDTIENDIIIPMAEIIRNNNYVLKPAIKALLSSEHFYQDFGCIIKSPVEFVTHTLNQTSTIVSGALEVKYAAWLALHQFTGILQMRYFDAPNVAGWKAYYQEPSYYQLWLNSVTLPFRKTYTDAVNTINQAVRGIRIDTDVLGMIENLSNPKDIESLIADLALVFFPQPLSEQQLNVLKNTLNPGLPDYEWTVEYEEYLNNPTDENIKRAVDSKLRRLFVYMMRMPEYQLI